MAETTTPMEGLEEKVALGGSKLGWPDLVVIILYFVFVLAVGLFVSIYLLYKCGKQSRSTE